MIGEKKPIIPCYVSGKGMHATDTTWRFKTSVMSALEASGLGYDTRYRYYRQQFPVMEEDEFARMICDPIEYYDQDWSDWKFEHKHKFENNDELVTAFFLQRDRVFQAEAKVAIFGFDEAGFGSGVNVMRFIYANKPVLGFYNPDHKADGFNKHNVMQLAMDHPDIVTLSRYYDADEIPDRVTEWLKKY